MNLIERANDGETEAFLRIIMIWILVIVAVIVLVALVAPPSDCYTLSPDETVIGMDDGNVIIQDGNKLKRVGLSDFDSCTEGGNE